MSQAKTNRWVTTVTLPAPSLEDNSADATRLEAALKNAYGIPTVGMDRDQLQALPEQLREWQFRATAVVFKETSDKGVLVHLAPPETDTVFCGLAVDLGTTRVVLRIIDLATGEHLGETVFDNPQIAVGPDVLTRIHHVETPGGLDRLHRLIVEGINTQIEGLCRSRGIGTEQLAQ